MQYQAVLCGWPSNAGYAMTHAHIYELGIKAYLAGNTLTDCPYDPTICSKTYDAWRDGWLDASRARWRRHSHAMAALRHAKTSQLAADRLAQEDAEKSLSPANLQRSRELLIS